MATKTTDLLDGPVIPPTFKAAGLSARFHKLVTLRQQYNQEIDRLTKLIKSDDENDPGLNIQIELAMAERGLKSVLVDDWCVSACDGRNVTIKRELLQQAMLERGLAADFVNETIEAATVVKPYTYIQVQDAKKLLDRIRPGSTGEFKAKVAATMKAKRQAPTPKPKPKPKQERTRSAGTRKGAR